ncbi:MAG TPA: GIY-YIG nuclease family protein [Patescibacteria group bacterium]|nr:GIY-YIG nuclease family protein [Patescibacteria group bacterium]
MYKVYILQSLTKKNKTYVGQTIKSVQVRLKEHNSGLSKFTKAYRPWKIVYFEQLYCKTCTDKREKFLKSGVGYKLRKILAEYGKEISSALQNGD